jgi:hypothetical protein
VLSTPDQAKQGICIAFFAVATITEHARTNMYTMASLPFQGGKQRSFNVQGLPMRMFRQNQGDKSSCRYNGAAHRHEVSWREDWRTAGYSAGQSDTTPFGQQLDKEKVQSTLGVFGPQERLKIPQIEKAGEAIGARRFQQEEFPFGTCLDIFQPILTQFVQKQRVGAVDDRQEHTPFPG